MNEEDANNFQAIINSPEFQATKVPITVGEADSIRGRLHQFTKQFVGMMQHITTVDRKINGALSRLEDADETARQLRSLAKSLADFRGEVIKRLEVLESAPGPLVESCEKL